MARNSPEGDKRRQAARRERLREGGVVSVTVHTPEAGKPIIKRVAELIREGVEPRLAARQAGGSNEPAGGSAAETQIVESDPDQPYLDMARAALGKLVSDFARSEEERDKALKAKEAAEVERDEAIAKAENLTAERDEALERESGALKAKEALEAENSALEAAKTRIEKTAAARAARLTAEIDLAREREITLNTIKDRVEREKSDLSTEIHQLRSRGLIARILNRG